MRCNIDIHYGTFLNLLVIYVLRYLNYWFLIQIEISFLPCSYHFTHFYQTWQNILSFLFNLDNLACGFKVQVWTKKGNATFLHDVTKDFTGILISILPKKWLTNRRITVQRQDEHSKQEIFIYIFSDLKLNYSKMYKLLQTCPTLFWKS